jgi:hypothetical protein
MRRILISLSSLIAVIAAFLSTSTAAFAMQVTPPDAGSPVNSVTAVHHSAGLDPWLVALIGVAGLIVGAVAMTARFARASRRHSATPAAI